MGALANSLTLPLVMSAPSVINGVSPALVFSWLYGITNAVVPSCTTKASTLLTSSVSWSLADM